MTSLDAWGESPTLQKLLRVVGENDARLGHDRFPMESQPDYNRTGVLADGRAVQGWGRLGESVMLLGSVYECHALGKVELGEALEEIVEVDAVGGGERLDAGNPSKVEI